jgi:hypothetical protein
MPAMTTKTELIKRLFHLLQWFTTAENEYKAILHAGVEQADYPNLMIPYIRKRTFKGLVESAEAGKKMFAWQRFETLHFIESGETAVVEYTWSAELKVKAGRLKQGQVIKAHICTVFEFRDEKIFRQRNYDCYEPIDSHEL